MTATLSQNVSVPVTFTDQLGGPLPPETIAAFYPIAAPPTNDAILASGYLGPSSSISVPLRFGEAYRARLIANRVGPQVPVQTFRVLDQAGVNLAVNGYVSPLLSQAGFVQEQFDNYPRGMYAHDGSFGLEEVIAETLASMFLTLQTRASQVISNGRLDSSADTAIDSWVADFFGKSLPRVGPEPNVSYIARVYDALSPENMTLLAIATKVRAYLALQVQYGAQQVFSLDTHGSVDNFGGLDTAGDTLIVPQVTAFDRQSNRAMSDTVGLLPGDVCVLFSYPGLLQQGLFLDGRHFIDGNTYLINGLLQVVNPPTPALAAYVNNFVKAVGVRIVYADNRVA